MLVARLPEIRRAQSFASLLQVIESVKCPGIGELTVYDTAIRVGLGQGVQPDRVYLHAGARVGANRLKWNVRRGSRFANITRSPNLVNLRQGDSGRVAHPGNLNRVSTCREVHNLGAVSAPLSQRKSPDGGSRARDQGRVGIGSPDRV